MLLSGFNLFPFFLVAYFTLLLTHSFGFLFSFGFIPKQGFILGAARPRQFRGSGLGVRGLGQFVFLRVCLLKKRHCWGLGLGFARVNKIGFMLRCLGFKFRAV